jgi:hypothetical protein
MGGAQVKGFDKYFGSRKRIKQSVMFKQKRLGLYDIGCYEHEKMMVRRFGC